MVQPTDQRFEVASLWEQVIRHKRKMLIAFCAVLCLSALVTSVMPQQFTSEAKIFVRLGRESIGLDPTATTGQYVSIQETRANEINSIVDLLKSRSVKEHVVDELGPETILGSETGVLTSIGSVLNPINLNPFRVYSERDEAIETLAKNLLVEATRRSNIVSLNCNGDSPELAQQVLQSLIKHARDVHIRANRTEGSRVFFEEQAQLLKQKLESAENELLAFKNIERIADPTKQRELYLEQTGELRTELFQAKSDLAAAETEASTMEQSIRGLADGELLETASGMPLRAASEMRANLYSLELKETELASKYTEDHFLLAQIRAQIADARKALTEESRNPQIIRGISESRGGLEQMMFERTARAAALTAKVETIERQATEARADMDRLNQNEVEFARLQREVDLASTNYRTYAEKLEETRIDEALSQDSISNFNVLQEPTISATPSSPRVKLNLAVGLFLAVMAALAFPLGSGATVARSAPRPAPWNSASGGSPARQSEASPASNPPPETRESPRSRVAPF